MRLIKLNDKIWEVRSPQIFADIIGSLFFFVGVIGILYTIIPYQLNCANKQPGIAKQCILYHPLTTVFGFNRFYPSINKAMIIRRTQKNGESYTLSLITPSGNYLISKSFNKNRSIVKKARDIINQYIQNSASSHLTIPGWTPVMTLLLFLFFIPFSVIFLLIASARTIIMNKVDNEVTLTKKFLGLWPIGTTKKYSLNEIKDFYVTTNFLNSNNNSVTYQLKCRLNDGTDFAVNTVTDGDRSGKESLAKLLNQFIQE